MLAVAMKLEEGFAHYNQPVESANENPRPINHPKCDARRFMGGMWHPSDCSSRLSPGSLAVVIRRLHRQSGIVAGNGESLNRGQLADFSHSPAHGFSTGRRLAHHRTGLQIAVTQYHTPRLVLAPLK